MATLYPMLFRLDGMTQAYLWGGEKLKPLVPDYPAYQSLAEIWTVSDRPEDDRVSVVTNGPLAGTTLRQLMESHADELLGNVSAVDGKFPLLVKLLDAKERLSLQVHPPAEVADELGGEPKTECWVFLEGSAPDTAVIAGLRSGTTRTAFTAAVKSGELEPLLHRIPVLPGGCMFLPSGRLHAIDAGCLLLEIQENSNTTYRVFDWNRIDQRTGKARELHVEKALASIDFADIKPGLQEILPDTEDENKFEHLIDCPQLTLERWRLQTPQEHAPDGSFELITALDPLQLTADNTQLALAPLQTVLVPASIVSYSIDGTGSYLRTYVGI